jgi:membrane-associated HD superfamily phosphohydrolase
MADDKDKNKEKKEKSFMENAEGFLSSWQDDYGKKNKEILDRKKKRDDEAKKEHEEFLKNLEAVKGDIKEKTKKMAEVLGKEFDGFKDALQQGAASVHEKFQLQKHFDDFKAFLKKAEKVGAEKFGDLTSKIEKDLSEVDSSKLTIEKPKTQEQEFDEIMKQAEQLIDNEITEKDEELDANHDKINKLFDDLDDKK